MKKETPFEKRPYVDKCGWCGNPFEITRLVEYEKLGLRLCPGCGFCHTHSAPGQEHWGPTTEGVGNG